MEYMDKPPVPALPLDQANELVEQIKRDNLIKKRIQGLKSYDNCFAGDEVVQWLIKSGKAKDVEAALPIGQSLLDNRLAHHVTDDHTFKNEHLFYRLYSDEPANIQKEAALFEDRVSKAKLAGYLKLRSLHTFSSPTFFDCYVLLNYDESENTTTAAGASSPSGTSSKKQQKQPGVLSSIADSISSAFGGSSSSASADIDFEGKSFPGVLYVYKLRSAPVPFLRLQVKDCVCSMTECVNCLADNYCFTITTNQIESTRNAQFTLCAKNSKQAEAWMFAMQAGGLEFEKVEEGEVKAASLFELTANDLITNEVIPLSNFKGKVCLVVNVSSKCGLTPKNYPELVQLYKTYGPKGFVVLAFPTNQFANQEPGTPEEIRKFVDGYGVDFPMFAKINVNGSNAHPVFKFLKQNLGGVLGSSIKWNFTKFLCDRNGKPVKRYMPVTQPMSFVADIEALLEEEYKPSDN